MFKLGTGLLICAMLVAAPAYAQALTPTRNVEESAKAAVGKAKGAVDKAKDTATEKTKQAVGATLIDINSASVEVLSSLRGIGPVRAAAIIKGRPYHGKNELLSKNVIPEAVYNDIKDDIIARQK